MRIRCCIALVGVLAMTAPAAAQDRGFYLGIGAGQARVDVETGSFDDDIRGLGFATSSTSADETDFAWKLFGGYQFNRHFALELGRADLGEFGFHTDTTGPAGRLGGEIKADAWFLDGVGMVPLNDRFSLLGRVGITRWDLDLRGRGTINGAPLSVGADDDGVGWKLGLGAEYSFNRQFSARLEWERYNDVGDKDNPGKDDVDVFGLTLRVRF